MKSIAALGVAGLISLAGVLWFLGNPVVVGVKVTPVVPSSKLPTFKPVPSPLFGEAANSTSGR